MIILFDSSSRSGSRRISQEFTQMESAVKKKSIESPNLRFYLSFFSFLFLITLDIMDELILLLLNFIEKYRGQSSRIDKNSLTKRDR